MTISQEQLFDSSLEALYMAVTDEEQWPRALAQLGRAFDSPRVAIFRAPPRLDGIHEMRALNHDPEAQRLYREYYWALDPSHIITRDAPVGKWLDTPHLFDPRTTPCPEYMDFAIKRGIRWVCGGKVHADPSSITLLGLQRPADHAPFDSAAAQMFSRLSVHIGRASALSAELRRAELAKGLSLAALNGLESPVFAVTAGARLLLANSVGERHLALGVPFKIQGGIIYSSDPDTRSRLSLALRLVSRSRGSAFRIIATGETWLVRVLPLVQYSGSALIYATKAERAPAPTNVLRQLLNFSQAEADVAQMIASGWSVKEIAHMRSVSVNTVRAQIREVLQKAGVRRQIDLVKLLTVVPPSVGDEDQGS